MTETYGGVQGAEGDTAAASSDNVSVLVDFAVDLDPQGLLFEIGGAGQGVYIGFTDGELIIRGGNGSGVAAADTAQLVIDPEPYLGKRYELIAVFTRDQGVSLTLDAYLFDTVELELISLGQDVASDSEVHGTGDWGVGTANGSVAGSVEVNQTDYNGIIYEASLFDGQVPALSTDDVFRSDLWLGRGIVGEPRDEIKILPALQEVRTVGTKINLSGADENFKPLGRRATMNFSAYDFKHSDIGQDPYVSTRPYDPRKRGTFWPKWLARQKFGKVGARVIRRTGYAGQPLSEYKSNAYVLEQVKQTDKGVSFYCRDELSRTEFLKAQVPAQSGGVLNADISETATSLTVAGAFTEAEYPSGGGTVRINDELIQYASTSYNDVADVTTFNTLTRGSDGSQAQSHEQFDTVQICERLQGTVEQVFKKLVLRLARIEPQLVNLELLATEQTSYLSAYNLDTIISEPTGIDTVLGWLIQETSVHIWWDERGQQINLKAIRAVSAVDIIKRLTYEDNIVDGNVTLEEKPRQRINILTTFYNPRNFAGDLNDPANFANANRILNGTTSDIDQYGNVVQSKVLFSRFLTVESEVAQTGSRIANRYADVPVFANVYLDAKDRDLWVAHVVELSVPNMLNALGDRDIRRYLITEAEEVAAGHLLKCELADITLDGIIYLITENGIGVYTPELFAQGNAFISNDAGLNPDGTNGARIT